MTRLYPKRCITPTVKPTQSDCIWAAGFIDGEAWLGMRPQRTRPGGKTYWYPGITVAQVVRAPIAWLRDRWGGSLHIRKNHTGHLGKKDQYVWQAQGVLVEYLLQDIGRYLKIKHLPDTSESTIHTEEE